MSLRPFVAETLLPLHSKNSCCCDCHAAQQRLHDKLQTLQRIGTIALAVTTLGAAIGAVNLAYMLNS